MNLANRIAALEAAVEARRAAQGDPDTVAWLSMLADFRRTDPDAARIIANLVFRGIVRREIPATAIFCASSPYAEDAALLDDLLRRFSRYCVARGTLPPGTRVIRMPAMPGPGSRLVRNASRDALLFIQQQEDRHAEPA
jgi:hypothetical protein